MPGKCSRHLIIVLMLCCSMIYTPVFAADQLVLPPDDTDSPEITHEPIIETLKTGNVIPINAIVTDNVGVKSVILFYRQAGAERYQQVNMQRIGDSDQYSATLDEQYYTAPGVEYYIQAMDLAGTRLLQGYAFSPLKIAIEGGEVLTADKPPEAPPQSEESNYKKWVWIGLGVLAVGALASSGGGGSDSSPPPTSILDLTVPTPTTNNN